MQSTDDINNNLRWETQIGNGSMGLKRDCDEMLSAESSEGEDENISTNNQPITSGKKSLPANGKKTKGRVKIKMEFIDNKLRRYTTFSKRKTGIMKKAYELSTLTGTQVMLLVASETGHVYTFATRKLQPMITSEAGKALIQTCLNSPDPPSDNRSHANGDQRMNPTGFEETEFTYSVIDDCSMQMDGGGGRLPSLIKVSPDDENGGLGDLGICQTSPGATSMHSFPSVLYDLGQTDMSSYLQL